MSRFRDQLAPILAGGLVALVALGVVLLLRGANNQGTDALTRAKLAQVQATADTFNERISSSLTAAAGLGAAPWQLTPNSPADEKVLQTYNIDPNAKSGFYLVNGDGVVTAGVLLRPGSVGRHFNPSAWPQVKQRLENKPAVALPVSSDGLTTELPSYDFVVAIRTEGQPTSVRGAIVVESALTPTSPFQLEIKQLSQHDPSSAAWFFVDSRGAVVASTENTGLGRPVEDMKYLTDATGQTTIGDRIVFLADVPALGWRVVFREDHAQFVHDLSGPLQQAGLILVLLLFVVGLTMVILLIRRLRQAREAERRLRELTRSQAEFISVVSHELRTPVAGVLGFLQTTVDHWTDLSDGQRLDTVRRAVSNARRLQAMTRDILDTESIESGRLGYHFQQVDIRNEIATAIEASSDADGTHVITFNAPSEPIPVDVDPDRIQQVLANLLENARKNSPPSEPIVVQTELVDGAQPRVRVSVIDRGPGVDTDSLERIFNKFVRGDDNAVTGTGLGLFIVRTIIEAHHGRVWCESSPGTRTAFIFELPVVRSTAPLTGAAR
jgi:signal transduction histidine kinase